MPGPGTWSAGDVLTANDLNAIGTWTSYTPTLAQNGNRTCTIEYAKYSVINKLCVVNVALTCTTTGSALNTITVTSPFTLVTNQESLGSGYFYDSSATDVILVQVQRSSTNAFSFISDASTSGSLGFTPNVTLGSGDILSFTASFEVS